MSDLIEKVCTKCKFIFDVDVDSQGREVCDECINEEDSEA